MGVAELLIINLILSVVVNAWAIWGAIDAGLKPESAWVAAEQSKNFWVVAQAAGFLICGVGLVLAVIYTFVVRPKVVSHVQS